MATVDSKETISRKQYNVLDLFCGCGGMSWGLAKKGFQIVAGLDIWDIALKTYQYNHKHAKAVNLDITDADPIEALKNIHVDPNNIDIIIGGPPCQGFSKNIPASGRFLEDPRNQLYKAYLRFVKEIEPEVVIIENVAEIYNAFGGVVRKEIVSTLERWGYKVEVEIIDMSHYGVPQKRRRCFFFASKMGIPSFPKERKKMIAGWDAISDLPVVNQGEGYDGMPYTGEATNDYQQHMRKGSDSLYNHIANVMRPVQTARLASIGPGQGLKDMPPELQVKGGYSGAYGRLDYTSVAPTITRWVFHIGSGRFAHPKEVRGLTMREAARIQSFSDDFHFMGNRNEQAGQIGNAVPPYFMEQLADNIRAALEGKEEECQQLELFPGELG
ncbi:MAG: DNA cytosine methyltransferase [Lachnospiraceae bacterium]|nr:DNA cytosine methyltransferase [Lachnospiraceae bacterium]